MAQRKDSNTRKSVSRNARTTNADNSASRTPKNPASFVSMLHPDAPPQLVLLAQNADRLTGTSPDAKAERAARERKQAEDAAQKAAGITLKGKRLQQAQWTVAQINFSAAAIHKLAFDGDGDLTDAERIDRYMTALGNIAETICRRCDVLDELLGERGGFGNFADQFEALTEERAAELEREEADHA